MGSVFKLAMTATFLMARQCMAAEPEGDSQRPSEVVKLDNSNFQNFIDEHSDVLVMFHAPWCHHCKAMGDAYDEAAATLKEANTPATLAKVDCQANTELSDKYEINGFPTLKWFHKGKMTTYDSGRKAQNLVDWVQEQTGPAMIEITKMEEVQPEWKVVFVLKAMPNSPLAVETLQAAEEYRGKCKFYVLTVTTPEEEELVAIDEGEAFKYDPTKYSGVSEFVFDEHIPMARLVDRNNYTTLMNKEIEIGWLCGPESLYEQVKPALRELSRKYRKDYTFVFLNSDTFGAHITKFLVIKEFPGFVANGSKGRFIMEVNKTAKLSEESLKVEPITEFLEMVKRGEVKKTIRSAEIPPPSKIKEITEVTSNTFEDVVLGSKKNVLVTAYAPWCGHCKTLQPVIEDVAKTLKDRDDFMVVTIDGTENEPPLDGFNWTGFPSIFFVPAGDSVPKKYGGERSPSAMLGYIKEHSATIPTEEQVKEEL